MKTDTRVIYKYELEQGETTITGWFTRFIHVGEQNGKLVVWMENSLTHLDFYNGAQVPRAEDEQISIRFFIVGTGWSYSAMTGQHVGTVQMSNGLVWHVFMDLGNAKWVQQQ